MLGECPLLRRPASGTVHMTRTWQCNLSLVFLTALWIGSAPHVAWAGNLSGYAWGENTGWINFNPSHGGGVTVTDSEVTGFAWGENVGWINLNPATGGVVNDGGGHLSGYAWGENVGWINFAPMGAGVTIDPVTGEWSGFAWGENVGWINFASTGPIPFGVTPLFVPPVIQFGSGGTSNQPGGVSPGSTRVFGTGTPRRQPDDMCIQIFAAGPDRMPGTSDDELLGSGGTDAEGSFVDPEEMPGIGLSRPLVAGDHVFALDVCSGLRGSTVVVVVALPAPALSWLSLLTALGALIWTARRNLRVVRTSRSRA
jgi:hypothetical protein